MNPHDLHGIDRRALLRAAACAPFAATSLLSTTFASPLLRAGCWLPRGSARTLLVLELQGGNDGLNTVIPVDDAAYAKLRPTLATVRKGALPLGQGYALHAAMPTLAGEVTAGRGAIVHGVGYRDPDRSHFRSRDIWHTADPHHDVVHADTTGWLGRAADRLAAAGAGVPAAAVGSIEVPLLLRSLHTVVPCLEQATDFTLRAVGADGEGERQALAAVATAPATDGGARAFCAKVAAAALQQAEQLAAGLRRYHSDVAYPDDDLGRALQLCARLSVAGFGTRLLHVALPGFDTHAQQLPTQQALLRALDRGLGAFLRDLAAHDRLRETAVLVHSEFGRRVQENQSLGTDHGAAAPVFVFAGAVQAGLHGTPPDLGDLQDGDVRATTDFRAVYAELLRWLGLDAAAVLGAAIAPLPLFTD